MNCMAFGHCAADAIGDNDIHKALTALCKQCSSSASRQLQAWMSVRRFEIFHKRDQSQYSPPPAIMCVHDAMVLLPWLELSRLGLGLDWWARG